MIPRSVLGTLVTDLRVDFTCDERARATRAADHGLQLNVTVHFKAKTDWNGTAEPQKEIPPKS